MSLLNQNTSECETVVRSLLEINLTCTKIMAILNSNHDVHIGSYVRHIILTEHANNFQLLPPEVVDIFMKTMFSSLNNVPRNGLKSAQRLV